MPSRFSLYVIALRIVRTRNKFAKPAVPSDKIRSVLRTDLIELDRRRRGFLIAFGDLANIFALGITGAAVERSEPALFQRHLAAAELAYRDLFGFFAAFAPSPSASVFLLATSRVFLHSG